MSVIDDGPGVPAHRRSGIFEPGVTTKPGGWGLGLPLAAGLAIEAQSGPQTAAVAAQGAARFAGGEGRGGAGAGV